ncbi:MAG: hypothetical protein HXX19_12955 [Rhodoferax sp.]|nr:hypothetical protein [Rhodoferax sp.]
MKTRTLVTSLLIAIGSISAYAQTAADTVQRDVNQQTRIESGLKDGQLNTKEATRLERQQARMDRLQAKDLKDGSLSPRERLQLQHAQNRASRDIKAAETNGVKGNPQSASSQRLQVDVQRDVNQQARIEQGLQSGALTNHEAGKLERGQARVDRKEANAAANGHVGALEQAGIQHAENVQSERIFHTKHNAHMKKPVVQ